MVFFILPITYKYSSSIIYMYLYILYIYFIYTLAIAGQTVEPNWTIFCEGPFGTLGITETFELFFQFFLIPWATPGSSLNQAPKNLFFIIFNAKKQKFWQSNFLIHRFWFYFNLTTYLNRWREEDMFTQGIKEGRETRKGGEWVSE